MNICMCRTLTQTVYAMKGVISQGGILNGFNIKLTKKISA